MPDEETASERHVAEQVEAALCAEGSDPGTRERHDARPGRLRVDYRYPDALPPFVLEVTTIDDGAHRSGMSAAEKLTRRLSAIAERDKLGAWIVAVETTKRIDRLEDDILELIGEELARPSSKYRRLNSYGWEDLARLPSDEARARFVARERRLRDAGIAEVSRIPEPTREHAVWVLPTTDVRIIGSFADWLQATIDDNAAKLAEAEGDEHHLGVLVLRFDASTFPEETPVPDLPGGVDVLWVVHVWGARHAAVWRARRGEKSWAILPAVEPPADLADADAE